MMAAGDAGGEERFLTSREVAAKLSVRGKIGVSDQTVRNYMGHGMPVEKYTRNGHALFDLRRCQAWVDLNRADIGGKGGSRPGAGRKRAGAGVRAGAGAGGNGDGGRDDWGKRPATSTATKAPPLLEEIERARRTFPLVGEDGGGGAVAGDRGIERIGRGGGVGGAGGGGDVTLSPQVEAKIELDRMKTEALRIDVAKARGELVDAVKVQQQITGVVTRARSLLMALPARVLRAIAGHVVVTTDQQGLVMEAVRLEVEAIENEMMGLGVGMGAEGLGGGA